MNTYPTLGAVKLEVCGRLVHDWAALADYLRIPLIDRAAFEPGRCPHGVWEWLELRGKLAHLEPALAGIGRTDLAEVVRRAGVPDSPSAHSPPRRFLLPWQGAAPPALRQEFIDRDGEMEEKTQDFVGRQFVRDELDRFLRDSPKGYFILRAGPGLGKTAVLARLVLERGYPHHFNIASEQGTPEAFYRNAAAQLIARYGLGYPSLPPEAARGAEFFRQILKEAGAAAAAGGERAVLVVDALDEAPPPGPLANPLGLPRTLPDNACLAVSTRRTKQVLEIDTSSATHVLELLHDQQRNVDDVRAYISGYAARLAPARRLAQWAARAGREVADVLKEIEDRSEWNFMYLRHVLPAVADGRFDPDRGAAQLPVGLRGYYQQHWAKMRVDDPARFEDDRKILRRLAHAAEPIPLPLLAKVSKVSEARVLLAFERWCEFLQAVRRDGTTRYRIYHHSYREFLVEMVDG